MLKPPQSIHSNRNSAAAQRSQYSRDRIVTTAPKSPQTESGPRRQDKHENRCQGCSQTSHHGKTMSRRDCPALKRKCLGCGIEGHYKSVCQKSKFKSKSASTIVDRRYADDEAPAGDFNSPDEEAYQAAVSFATNNTVQDAREQDFHENPHQNNRE